MVKILAPLTDNPNAPRNDGKTPIYWAAYKGHTEIVKILAPLTNNPNVPNRDGRTPIHCAAEYGHTEIVKCLVPLTEDPNAPDNDGNFPSLVAKTVEIGRILKPFKFKTSRKRKVGPLHTKPSMKRDKKV